MLRRKAKDGSTIIDGGTLTQIGAINMFYPVGSIYMSTVSTNPGSGSPAQFPGTTWVAWGAGRAVVGVGSNGTNTYTSEQTFGADTCTLTAAQCGVNTHTHSHTLAAPSHTHTATTGAAGTHYHQPNTSPGNYGFLAYVQGGTVARRAISSGSGYYAFSVTTSTDIDYATATATEPDHTHSVTTGAPSATALTGSMGAVSGASSASSHDIRQSSIATYLWKRTA